MGTRSPDRRIPCISTLRTILVKTGPLRALGLPVNREFPLDHRRATNEVNAKPRRTSGPCSTDLRSCLVGSPARHCGTCSMTQQKAKRLTCTCCRTTIENDDGLEVRLVPTSGPQSPQGPETSEARRGGPPASH